MKTENLDEKFDTFGSHSLVHHSGKFSNCFVTLLSVYYPQLRKGLRQKKSPHPEILVEDFIVQGKTLALQTSLSDLGIC